MSLVKEPGYFAAAGGNLDDILPQRASTSVRSMEDYLGLFAAVGGERAIGEATPIYLYFPWVPQRIRDVIPDPRFVAILRNPADRAFSHYVWGRAFGVPMAKTFGEAVDLELEQGEAGRLGLGIVGPGFYGKHLASYFELFDSTRVLVVLQDDLARDPAGTLRSVYTFLGVDPTVDVARKTVYNEGRPIIRNQRLANFSAGRSRFRPLFDRVVPAPVSRRALPALKRWSEVAVDYPEDVRTKLLNLYADDIGLVERLTHRDLSSWLE